MSNEITPREAAQELNVGLDRVYRLLYSGKLQARRDEDGWHIPVASIQSRKQSLAAVAVAR
ncbi:MAG TPA: helix-turn-helix domain-containing protein [Terriglobales bacterium]|nr:helix-turn-helix domain-containing protein [Terriglobales bacterium]